MDLHGELINLTSTLVQFKTVTGDFEANREALQFVERYFDGVEIRSSWYRSNNFDSLVLTYNVSSIKDIDIILHGHIDIVPADEDSQYTPNVRDSKLYGRGALDMKGGLACLMHLLKQIALDKKNVSVALFVTSDEEGGGVNGTEYLFKETGYRSAFFISAEGERDYLLKYKQKGVCQFKLEASTEGEHSAYTWKSENAIEVLFDCFAKIKTLFPADSLDVEHWYSTINLGKLQGGTATNSIPSTAVGYVDVRFTEDWTDEKAVFNAISDVVAKCNGVSLTLLYGTALMNTSSENRLLKNLNDVAKKELQLVEDIYFKNHGTNDARFASANGIPAVGFGPIGDHYHARNEFVSTESLVSYYRILAEFIELL